MPLRSATELGTILSVWAHPDDEAYLAGALMAQATDNGQRVMCVTATRGEEGSWDHQRWPPARMGAIREAELAECLRILGVTEHRWLDYRDATCDAVPDDEGAAKIAAIIEEVVPDTILTFGPDGQTEHPDHIAVHRWVTRAFEEVAPDGCRLHHACVCDGPLIARFKDLFVKHSVVTETTPRLVAEDDLSIYLQADPELTDRKYRALWAQVSQVEPVTNLFGAAGEGKDLLAEWIVEEAFVDA